MATAVLHAQKLPKSILKVPGSPKKSGNVIFSAVVTIIGESQTQPLMRGEDDGVSSDVTKNPVVTPPTGTAPVPAAPTKPAPPVRTESRGTMRIKGVSVVSMINQFADPAPDTKQPISGSTSASASTNSPVLRKSIKEGFLKLLKESGMKSSWMKRYIVLERSSIAYYRSNDAQKALKTLELHGDCIARELKEKMGVADCKNVLEIFVDKKNSIVLQASTQRELTEWITAVCGIIDSFNAKELEDDDYEFYDEDEEEEQEGDKFDVPFSSPISNNPYKKDSGLPATTVVPFSISTSVLTSEALDDEDDYEWVDEDELKVIGEIPFAAKEPFPAKSSLDLRQDDSKKKEKELAKQKEAELAKQRESELANKKELELAIQKEAELAKKKEQELSAQRELAAQQAKQKEAELAKQKESELAKKKELELAKQKESELAKKKEQELAKQKETELAKKKEQELAAQRELAAQQAKQKEAELAKQRELELAKKKELELAKQKEAELAAQREAELAKEREREILRQKEMELNKQIEEVRAKEQELLKQREEQLKSSPTTAAAAAALPLVGTGHQKLLPTVQKVPAPVGRKPRTGTLPPTIGRPSTNVTNRPPTVTPAIVPAPTPSPQPAAPLVTLKPVGQRAQTNPPKPAPPAVSATTVPTAPPSEGIDQSRGNKVSNLLKMFENR